MPNIQIESIASGFEIQWRVAKFMRNRDKNKRNMKIKLKTQGIKCQQREHLAYFKTMFVLVSCKPSKDFQYSKYTL